MTVQSKLNVGTTFTLYFPQCQEAPLAPLANQEAPRGNGQEILVVDDEEQVAAYVSARMRQLGYMPFVFHDPRAALKSFRETPARFSAVVTDLTMPHLTGLDLLRQIRQLRPSMPVIILTGYNRDLAGEKLDSIARCIVLQKPFSGEELSQALRSVLDSVPASPKT
jgi:DNA-binding response OmpR family regulator